MGQSLLPCRRACGPVLSQLGGLPHQYCTARNAPVFATSVSRRALALDGLAGQGCGLLELLGEL